MKAITAILLTIATLAAAAPNADANTNTDKLSARQGCAYSCVCSTVAGGSATASCCTGGTLTGTRCDNMNFAAAASFAGCCKPSGGFLCNVPAGCPEIPRP